MTTRCLPQTYENAMKKLDEQNMSALEDIIPFLAEEAVKKARIRTLQSGRNVVEAVNGNLLDPAKFIHRDHLRSFYM